MPKVIKHFCLSMYKRTFLALFFMTLLFQTAAFARRYTVMVSLDGFRDDYTRAYSTPFFDAMARMGVSATMQPSFPSKTFPNHYTLVTGLYPDHHGIIANTFHDDTFGLTFSLGNKETKQDPRFWGGEPVWNTAARQHHRVGVVYWPGSDVKVGGRFPDYYHDYEVKPLLSFADRVAEVGRYLRLPEAERPDLVLAYFEDPDHQGHSFGPFSPQTREAVERMDHTILSLYETLQTLPERDSINLIVLSDHGMTQIDEAHLVNPADYVQKDWIERIRYDIPTQVWPAKGCERKVYEALSAMPHVRVWRKAEVPAYLHYGSNRNIAPIVINPDLGWTVGDKALRICGTHGFDPTYVAMQVMVRAVGPDFKQGYHKPDVFGNVNIYSLLCHLLGIEPSAHDGNLQNVSDMLR